MLSQRTFRSPAGAPDAPSMRRATEDQPGESATISLEEFAPETSPCLTCQLPAAIVAELEQARLRDPKRFTYAVIEKWLLRIASGTTTGLLLFPVPSESSLRRHFKHVPAASA